MVAFFLGRLSLGQSRIITTEPNISDSVEEMRGAIVLRSSFDQQLALLRGELVSEKFHLGGDYHRVYQYASALWITHPKELKRYGRKLSYSPDCVVMLLTHEQPLLRQAGKRMVFILSKEDASRYRHYLAIK